MLARLLIVEPSSVLTLLFELVHTPTPDCLTAFPLHPVKQSFSYQASLQNYKAQEMAAFDHTTPAGSHAWAAWSSAAREMGCLKWLELIVETKQVLDWMLQIS